VAIADDIVTSGLIRSMAAPGGSGNTIGISILATELDAKKLEILKEIVPAARVSRCCATRQAAPKHGSRCSPGWRALSGSNCRRSMPKAPPISPRRLPRCARAAEALDILASPLLANFQHELGRLSLEYKPQAICQFREMAEAGCLASYGVKRPEMYAMVTAYVEMVRLYR
jgi:putative tryptophan/tyrosine transport system substrate-binding protein